jgi:hypothetical protein
VTNPRNHLGSGMAVGIDEAAGSFSQWPGTLGLAATRDAALVEEFARIAVEEYVSVGIRGAYHPQIDLATEPRWGRISGTLGEDADLTCAMTEALVRGFQGRELGPKSVAVIVKHFPGGGPADDGHGSPHPWRWTCATCGRAGRIAAHAAGERERSCQSSRSPERGHTRQTRVHRLVTSTCRASIGRCRAMRILSRHEARRSRP